jgi:ketosteroid isomerase-like protein
MQNKELSAIALRWFEAFNEHNLEKLLALYHNEATHYSPRLKMRQPETHGLIKGKEALRAWWQDAFVRLPILSYEVLRLTPHDDRVFMEYIRHASEEEDLYVGELLEIKDGYIVTSRVFHG